MPGVPRLVRLAVPRSLAGLCATRTLSPAHPRVGQKPSSAYATRSLLAHGARDHRRPRAWPPATDTTDHAQPLPQPPPPRARPLATAHHRPRPAAGHGPPPTTPSRWPRPTTDHAQPLATAHHRPRPAAGHGHHRPRPVAADQLSGSLLTSSPGSLLASVEGIKQAVREIGRRSDPGVLEAHAEIAAALSDAYAVVRRGSR